MGVSLRNARALLFRPSGLIGEKRVWARLAGVFQTLIITKRELRLATADNRKLPLWGISKLQRVCLVTGKINSKKVTQKNQNNYYEKNIDTYISILILFFLF